MAMAGLMFVTTLSASERKSVSSLLIEDGRFTTLVAALEAAELIDAVETRDAVTLLAPTDAAFELLPDGTLESLLAPESKQQLTDILLYHAVGLNANSDTVRGLQRITTLQGGAIDVLVSENDLLVNEGIVVDADLVTSNGVVHVIDRVLLPPPVPDQPSVVSVLAEKEEYSTLVAAVTAAGLVEVLSAVDQGSALAPPFTVFAPTNDAFAKLSEGTVDSLLLPENKATLEAILLHHVLGIQAGSGVLGRVKHVTAADTQTLNVIARSDGVSINNAAVVEADLFSGNGVVHGIDTVLIPATTPESRNLAEVVEADGRFTTLLAAVGAADLAGALSGTDPLTVLAPTDEAFAMLPSETLADLLKPENKAQLVEILQYHIVAGAVDEATVRSLKSASTLGGEDIQVLPTVDGLLVNDAKVLTADIGAANGLVHAIDRVLLPGGDRADASIPEFAQADGRFQTLLAAVGVANLGETLSSPGPFTVLAPTDDAFSRFPVGFLLREENRELLTSILLYHVYDSEISSGALARAGMLSPLQGETAVVSTVNGDPQIDSVSVIVPDVRVSNGIIHVIDEVLVPPSVLDEQKVLGIAGANGGFQTLLAAIEAAGLTEALKGEGPFTVLAPTDEAFAKLPEGTLDDLLKPENKEHLAQILLYHVVPAAADSHAVLGLKSAETLAGQSVSVVIDERDHSILVDGALVVAPDIKATNGIIHAIDSVLLPPDVAGGTLVDSLVGDTRFETLVAAVTAAGLADTLASGGPFTVLAPTDEAFDKLPDGLVADLLKPENAERLRDILLYHVLNSQVNSAAFNRLDRITPLLPQRLNVIVGDDGGLSVNNASVLEADQFSSNGVFHAIDTVLIPATDPETRNLADVLAADGRFTTLLAAVGAAELAETVTTAEALTILAPTDAAFAALPESTLSDLLLPENKEQLQQILLYHVVGSRADSSAVRTLASAPTVAGDSVNILLDGGTIFVNDAEVTQEDIAASNGVVHVIDRVLLPPSGRSMDPIPVLAEAGGFTTLLAAVQAAGLGDVLSGDGPLTVLAPTDEAFASMPEGQLELLLQPENVDLLRDILLYHVFNSEISSSAFGRVSHPYSASGAGVAVAEGDGGLTFNGSGVVSADLLASNGVVHAIDTVLIPVPEILEISEVSVRKGNLAIEWTANRTGPYKIQRSAAPDSLAVWEDVMETREKSARLPLDGGSGYFRIVR